MNTFIPTLELLGRVKTLIAAIEIAEEVKLFDKVEFYAHANIVAALADLRIFKQKVCLIVPSGDSYENRVSGRELRSDATREFILLFADRDYGKRQSASTGDNNTIGVLAMKDALEEKLLGQNLDYDPLLIRLQPIQGEAVVVTDKEKELISGREAWAMTWRADAGTKFVTEP